MVEQWSFINPKILIYTDIPLPFFQLSIHKANQAWESDDPFLVNVRHTYLTN